MTQATTFWSALECIALSVAGGLGLYLTVGGLLELAFYRRADARHAWKCQATRWPTTAVRRSELLLGCVNVIIASAVSGVVVASAGRAGLLRVYGSSAAHGVAYSVTSGVAYAVGVDLALYWGHRLLHTRVLVRAVHRVHHRFTAPTPFAAMAMHPVELALYQTIMAAPLFFVPLHAGAVIATVAFAQLQAVLAHSGVKLPAPPLVASASFHDAHHAHFDGNYGHTFVVWDQLFGTARRCARPGLVGAHDASSTRPASRARLRSSSLSS